MRCNTLIINVLENRQRLSKFIGECKIKLKCNRIFYFLLLFFPHLCSPFSKEGLKLDDKLSDDTRKTHISMEQLP